MEPLILSTWRFGKIANTAGWPVLIEKKNALDAVEAACAAVEEDPSVTSVGYGGFPDASGEVTLDALIMTGPDRCGAVACLRRFAPAISVARRVMEKTPHLLLVGSGAEEFAFREGFRPRELLSETARRAWQDWKQRHLERPEREDSLPSQPWETTDYDSLAHDTIGVLAMDETGAIAGGCSTSGLAFKLPGRVGDSPIVGHGLYVDREVGAAVGTGHGELIMRVCGSFLIVEEMRRGKTPLQAIQSALSRILHTCRPKKGQQAAFIALRKDGTWAGASLRAGFQMAVRDSRRDELLPPVHVVLSE